jgi:hypothetical protein
MGSDDEGTAAATRLLTSKSKEESGETSRTVETLKYLQMAVTEERSVDSMTSAVALPDKLENFTLVRVHQLFPSLASLMSFCVIGADIGKSFSLIDP